MLIFKIAYGISFAVFLVLGGLWSVSSPLSTKEDTLGIWFIGSMIVTILLGFAWVLTE